MAAKKKSVKSSSPKKLPPSGGSSKRQKSSDTARYSEDYGPYNWEMTNRFTNQYSRKYVTDAIRGWGSHAPKTPYGSGYGSHDSPYGAA